MDLTVDMDLTLVTLGDITGTTLVKQLELVLEYKHTLYSL